MNYQLSEHQLYPDSILIREFSGEITVDEIIESWERIRLLVESSKTITGISNDFSTAKPNIRIKDLQRLIQYLKHQEFLKTLKVAIITNSPKTITIPLMIMKQLSGLNIKVFSTSKAANEWITIGLS